MKTFVAIFIALWFSFFIEKTFSNSIVLPIFSNRIKNEKSIKQVYYNRQEKSYSVKMEGDTIQILTNINVGGINQKVIVDSGSVLLVVPSSLCKNCHQPQPYYSPSLMVEFMECTTKECHDMGNTCIEFRDTHRRVCGNGVHYLQNTEIITLLVKDTFSFSNETGDVLATFGAIVSNTGRPLEHGILGMGKTCDGCRKSPVENIFEKTNIKRIFSMWLDNNYQGLMNLGEVEAKYEKSIMYTPLVTIDQSHYGVLLSSASLVNSFTNETLIMTSKDFGEVIIDTGTSEALLEVNAYKKITQSLSKGCPPGCCGENSLLDGYCYNYPDEYFDSFPVIHVEMLGGAFIDIEPQSYFITTYADGVKYRCFGIKQSPLKGKSIIGLSWLRNNYLVFDTEHNRMGFSNKEFDFDPLESYDFSSNDNEISSSNNDDYSSIEREDTSQDGSELIPNTNRIVVKITDTNQLEQEYQKSLQQEPKFLLLEEELNFRNNKNNENHTNNLNKTKTDHSVPKKVIPIKTQNDLTKSEKMIISKCNINFDNQTNYCNSDKFSNFNNLITTKPISTASSKSNNQNPINNLEPPISKKKPNPVKSIHSICKFEFTQKKYFQWIDNNANFYTFWESTIENLSDKSMNSFLLSTMDNISYVIGMNYTLEGTTTQVSLPPNILIAPKSSYRWLYLSTAKDAISFSVGNCSVLFEKKK
ncbi:hypothetical protein ACTFIV_000281 [Dictyostelium citrinum]